MAQNIYDDPEFFDGYAQLPRSVEGLDGAPEWRSLRAMLPDLRDARVVDLGCGYGWFCRWAAGHGAESVLGLDISERMLAKAWTDTPLDAAIRYRRTDLDELDDLELPAGSFDLAYSSLTFHYLTDLDRMFAVVADALTSGGRFVFSVEHPLRTAPVVPGMVGEGGDRRYWPLDHYLVEGPRTTEWIAPGVVKQHRRIDTYLTALISRGFSITHVEEWCPTAQELDANPDWSDELHCPTYLLISAERG